MAEPMTADSTEERETAAERMADEQPAQPVPGEGQPREQQRGLSRTKDPAAFRPGEDRPWEPRTGPRGRQLAEEGFAFTG